jgi:elongation factor Ts
MAVISASMVKELRDRTGVGMMDCRKALETANGDLELAIEHLRKAGIAKAATKAGRSAKEGRLVSLIRDGAGVLAEVLCETDFVAKTGEFQAFAAAVAEKALTGFPQDGDISAATAEALHGPLTQLIGKIGENMQIRRVLRWQTAGQLGSYLHMGGRIGVLIEVEGQADRALVADICMHVAAFSPQYVCPKCVPEQVLAKEREIAAAQVQGKPANIVDKIVVDKVNKWYTEVCLTQQPWIRDDKKTLAQIAPQVTVKRFVRWQVGEAV